MFVLGVIVLGFLALHLFHFWAKMQLQTFLGLMGMDAVPNHDPYTLVRELFGNPVYSVVYLIWIWALWFHLTHGFWSAFQIHGSDNAKLAASLKVAGTVYASGIALGFSAYDLFPLFLKFNDL
jgi:succinate dehydrogenase / fumarate reductase cytochrome b subunit